MKIVQYPHPALRHKARPLTAIDKQVQLQAGEMLALMNEANGLGLAANQVVLPYQIIVLNLKLLLDDPNRPAEEGVYLNPVILERGGGLVEGEEGCLSFPELFQKVRRSKTVRVRAYNLRGESLEIQANDLVARVWQHEVDHLQGVLFIDKMGPVAKLASRGALKDFEREFRKAQERGEIPPDADIERYLKDLGFDD
jgi:peptide deformylase